MSFDKTRQEGQEVALIEAIRLVGTASLGEPICLQVDLQVTAAVVIEPDLKLEWRDHAGRSLGIAYLRHRIDAVWLPRGDYRISLWSAACELPSGAAHVACELSVKRDGERRLIDAADLTLEISESVRDQHDRSPGSMAWEWQLHARNDTTPVEQLSWNNKGGWFHGHFDHAARVVIDYMFKGSRQLRGRILDVGCGDGITDLGIALHCGPELLIGIDPFSGFQRLPQVMSEHGLSPDAIPQNLRFMTADGNHLPFPDDSFDVVLSWGSLEHIAGGYLQCMREIKRVLRDGGLFFVHPGLFYSDIGHHLGEFSSEPFFHLTKTREQLHDLVHTTAPKYIDRAGEFSTPEQYWQWFNELNHITVSEFEQQLRALEFEPWRVALRTADVIEYVPELLPYSMQDLATNELYMSCINRKTPHPASFAVVDPAAVRSEIPPNEKTR